MEHTISTQQKKGDRLRPIFSAILPDGTLVETLYRSDQEETLFAISKDGAISYEPSLPTKEGPLVPYSPRNNLLTSEVVLLPSAPMDYGIEAELIGAIRSYIHRYVDVSPLFETIASYYVLLSWVYDGFDELPYLRVRGDAGSGKTRFLTTVGSICYKPIFASGASTVSPIFRILDAVRGTLVIDEGDFRASDEKSEIVKILNNGNAKGYPVLRTEAINQREFAPMAYTVYGPKLVATRGYFEDRALETRCLTEETGSRALRDDISISAPQTRKAEALELRNKLLLFRLRNRGQFKVQEALVDRTIEPRLSQIFVPLLSIIRDPAAQTELRSLARLYHQELIADRGQGMEGQILEVIRDLIAGSATRPTIKEIADWFSDRHGEEYDKKVTAKWIGRIIRDRLQVKTQRGTGGVYVIPLAETPKLHRLYERYGLVVAASANGDSAMPSEGSGHSGLPEEGAQARM